MMRKAWEVVFVAADWGHLALAEVVALVVARVFASWTEEAREQENNKVMAFLSSPGIDGSSD